MRLEKRILIVDDDDAIRALVVTVLRRRGYQLDTARNGVDAIEKLTSCSYSLVILDLMMPRMSGYGVLDELAKIPEVSRPLVLVLTAGLEPKPFDKSFVIGTMHKPFDIELLVDTVSGCVTAAVPREQLDSCPDGSVAQAARTASEKPN
ncbi:MAG TPA: response regulator [Thermoanaerobaculia bacterium]|nr:response regulator [Thermoanaerobaculia bacterium]